jgi:hypothetical protein
VAKDSSEVEADSTHHELEYPSRRETEPEETTMFNPTLGYFDATADMTEYGLIAFASPEFVEKFVQQLAQAPATGTDEALEQTASTCKIAA